MVLKGAAKRCGLMVCALGVLLVGSAVPAAAQTPVTVTGGVDVVNRYMFRGIRQNADGAAIWPAVDVGIGAFSGDGGLKSVTVNLGTWNSLHTDPSGWYESDLYAAITLAGSRAAFTTTYTSYTSPDDRFAHVKELMFKLAVDDSNKWGLKPYAAVAFELDDAGQADGGSAKGTYFELGMAPSIPLPRNISLNITTKFGFSLSNYYQDPLTGQDTRFGYSSSGAMLVIPLGEPDTPAGHWNVRGGFEYQGLGTATTNFNGGDKSQFIGSIGVGFSY